MAEGGAPEGPIPVYTTIEPIYGSDGYSEGRFQAMKEEFSKLYGHEPKLFARAPGRVNLIGEHIDYEGYSVLPMAIRQDTIVAVRVSEGPAEAPTVLRIANMRPGKYPACSFPADPSQEVDLANHVWANYFICGYKGVLDHFREKQQELPKPSSLDILIDGIVPTGAGLSSSAALVCSSAIAVMAVHDLMSDKAEVADFACRCERHIGTQSGGMDQAISILARPGVAKLIDFNPVRAHDVALPPGGTFVIANSLTVSNKAETADVHYNMRVVECRLAAMVLALKLGWDSERALQVKTLGEVEELCSAATSDSGPLPAVEANLHEEPYTAEELEATLGINLPSLFASSATSLAVLKAASHFKLRQRSLHVYAEAQRVHKFRQVAASTEGNGEVLAKLGGLMNDSHTSCSKLYECSCPELEELVALCRSAGALGSRLTGAGWGGCTVSLVMDADVDAFIQTLKDKFYASRVEANRISAEELDACVFPSKPSGGAAIFNL